MSRVYAHSDTDIIMLVLRYACGLRLTGVRVKLGCVKFVLFDISSTSVAAFSQESLQR